MRNDVHFRRRRIYVRRHARGRAHRAAPCTGRRLGAPRRAATALFAWALLSAGIAPSAIVPDALSPAAFAADTPSGVLDEAAERVEQFIEHTGDSYYTLVDQAGQTLTFTSLSLAVGDTYIDELNRQYEVIEMDGTTARVKYVDRVRLPDVPSPDAPAAATASGIAGWWARLTTAVRGAADETDRVEGPIAIYFTHSDESYVPASGVSSKETGDVYKVGDVLKSALEDEGYEVVYSENNHNPHDGQAYNRSRRTVTDLLKQRPSTMIDIHRDAGVPLSQYTTTVQGEPASKVRLVVGKQNENRQLNLEYAKRIKSVADEQLPGLVKGIFHAHGNYNQDVGPRMILLEFGTEETSLADAEQAARFIAQAIPAAAGLTAAASRGEAAGSSAAGWRSALWVILIAAVAAVGYVALNARSGGEVAERLRTFFAREFPRVGTGGDGEDGDGEDRRDDGRPKG